MNESFGIDFGTTNSAMVGISPGHVANYGDEAGQPYPSIVAIDKMTGNVICRGRDAWRRREELRPSCHIITSVKTLLDSNETWKCDTRTWTPQEVTTEILKGLKDEVIKRSRGAAEINEAIVSIPIGFSPGKRRTLRTAAAKAGIQVKSFVSEPTAAVYRKYGELKKWSKIAVFDWGGGTLDISIVEIKGGMIHEIATLGLTLGGDNLDRRIAEWAHNQILMKKGGTESFESMAPHLRDKLIVRAEEAKRQLSKENETDISLHDYGKFEIVNINIDAKTLKRLLMQEITRAIELLTEAITERAGMSIEELGCVLMVGGSSKLRGLYEKMVEIYSCEIIHPERDSDWYMAHGAAMLGQHEGSYIVSRSIGLELSDETYFPLLKNGDAVDHENKTWSFGLVEDSDNARFIFVEGSNEKTSLSKRNRRIGNLTVPTNGFINEAIKLEAQIDKDLFLKVRAKSDKRGKSTEATWHYPEMQFVYKLPL